MNDDEGINVAFHFLFSKLSNVRNGMNMKWYLNKHSKDKADTMHIRQKMRAYAIAKPSNSARCEVTFNEIHNSRENPTLNQITHPGSLCDDFDVHDDDDYRICKEAEESFLNRNARIESQDESISNKLLFDDDYY